MRSKHKSLYLHSEVRVSKVFKGYVERHIFGAKEPPPQDNGLRGRFLFNGVEKRSECVANADDDYCAALIRDRENTRVASLRIVSR